MQENRAAQQGTEVGLQTGTGINTPRGKEGRNL